MASNVIHCNYCLKRTAENTSYSDDFIPFDETIRVERLEVIPPRIL
ncbi:MAG: hypothetical protein PUC01_01915 [Spirochaetales bacterium]|nr:hypothetical protein [Spirochaetales bacterium]